MRHFLLTILLCLLAHGQAPKTKLSVLVFPNNDTSPITNCGPGQPCLGGQPTVYGGTTIINWADVDVDGTAAHYNWSKPDAAIELWSGMGTFSVTSITAGNPTVVTLSRPPNPSLPAGSMAVVSGGTGTGCSLLSYTTAVVNSVSGNTITLAINTSGCSYTANSATLYYKFGGFNKKTNLVVWGVGYSGQNPPAYVANVTASLTILSVTATNPAVLTLSGTPSPLPIVGTAIKITGTSGTGCSLNGDAQVNAVSGTSMTVALNATGCSYAANSGTLKYCTNGYQQVTSIGWGTTPVYYNSVYKNAYKTFVQAFLQRYGSHSNVGYIRIGLGQGGETYASNSSLMMALPDCTGSTPCTQSQIDIVWQNYIGEMTSFMVALHPMNQLMTTLGYSPNTGNPQWNVTSWEATNAVALGFGFGVNGLQQADVTNAPTVIATLKVTVSAGQVSACSIVTGGSGYSSSPLPLLKISGDGTGASGTLTVSGGSITGCSLSTHGSGYTFADARVFQSTSACSSDYCYQFQNNPSAVKELQTLLVSDPLNQTATGTLTTLLPYGVNLGVTNFEIYIDDWCTAYDSAGPQYATGNCLGTGITCGAMYRNLFASLAPPPDTNALTIDHHKYMGTYGPQRMLAGYTHIYHLDPMWSFSAVCDPVSNTCYSGGYTPDGSERFYVSPDVNPPPGGVQNQPWQLLYPTYKALNVGTNGNAAGHWNIAQSGSSTPITITSTGLVKFYIDSGNFRYNLTNALWLQDTAPNAAAGQFNGFPAGTTFRYWNTNGYQSCFKSLKSTPASGYYNWGNSYACVEVYIPADAVPGIYNAGWTFCKDSIGTGCSTASWPVTVEQVPMYPKVAPATIPAMPAIYTDSVAPCVDSNFSPIPGSNCSFSYLATSGNADSPRGAAKWCPDTSNPDNFMENADSKMVFSYTGETVATPASAWYYDGGKTFFNIASFFGDPTWENCARMIVSRYTQMGPGAIPFYTGINSVASDPSLWGPYNTVNTRPFGANWRHFPDGIGLGLARFNSGVYSSTLVPNRWNAQMTAALWRLWNADFASPGGFGPGANHDTEREHAYALNIATTMREHLGLSVTDGSPFALQYQRIADAVATIALMNLNPPANGPYDIGPQDYQAFMTAGLVVESMRRYYDQTKDPRYAYLIKRLLDDVIVRYRWDIHTPTWMKSTDGPWCFGTAVVYADPTVGWYTGNNADGNCGYVNQHHTLIGGMLASNYAWWWRNFGGSDNTFATFADELFSTGLNNGFYRPKDFNQVFRYAFEYVRWRQGR